ncbi:winged helix-turn-helix domain-containing protein [Streptomyces sp. NPDC059072]|uniref:winged helix-turn-helix domain-containing protein n=1 Tax=Streptomyces sp. NPDC059072 TaxID=3346715 RepID=UPI0036D0BDCB
MVSLRLTFEDLSRIRFIGTLGADFETRCAEARFAESQQDVFVEWRRKVKRRLRAMGPVEASAINSRTGPRSLTHSSAGGDRSFHAMAVEPFWAQIQNYLELAREVCGRAIVSGGVESVLNNLHPAISWEAPVLRVNQGPHDREIELTGKGLVLAPSLFAVNPLLLDSSTGWQGTPTLVYTVVPDSDTASTLWQGAEGGSALSELLGHTRASVLESVRVPGSTGEISRRLHISNPSASKHVGVLRRSGFVTTERKNNATVHRLTLLGEAVLG